MLIDERTISQAEHSGLFLEAANGTKCIGSPTQGANCDMTNLSAPGGMHVQFSGQGVWRADGRQLQHVGLRLDVEVRPTLVGIRAGRDEVLDTAIDYLGKVEKRSGRRFRRFRIDGRRHEVDGSSQSVINRQCTH
jgi:C-terminal processing protease CtpA/Prc